MADPLPAVHPSSALCCIGVDHHRTPLALRERLSVHEEMMPVVLNSLCTVPGVESCVVLSTCNRLEIYANSSARSDVMISRFAEAVGADPTSMSANAYTLTNSAAVRHLFRVVASLESMVIGEYQIVHQVKTAFERARELGACSGDLDRLFQRALAVAKEVRSQTTIGAHKVSVASVGVDLAKHIHGDLSAASLLVVGAGEIAELATTHLLGAGVRKLTLINRTHERALDLAHNDRFRDASIDTLPWAQLQQGLAKHDIVVTSTAATRPVITADEVRQARRRSMTPLVIIDLAVPRDVEVAVGELGDVFRYDLDHLDSMVAANRDLRSEDIQEVERLVDAQLSSFEQKLILAKNTLPAEISQWFEQLVSDEFQRLEHKLDHNEQQRAEIRYSLQRLAAKMRHRSLHWLQQDPTQREQALREIFGL